MTKDSRERMVRSAASLIRRRGLSATSFSELVAHSGAPRGSIYHHFPGGKQQLAEEAVRMTADRALAYLQSSPASTSEEVLERFIEMWRQIVLTSGGTAGCVVAGVAIDSGAEDEGQIRLVRETFQSWIRMLAEQLESTGVPAERAMPIAVATMAGMEGALILCRADGGVGALNTVGSELHRLLRA